MPSMTLMKRFEAGFAVAVVTVFMICTCHAKSIDVGGAVGWTSYDTSQITAPNYGAWASSQKLYVGDSLVFKFAAAAHNVWQMKSQASYQSCDFYEATLLDEGNSGFYTWTATQSGVYYFSCDKGAEGVGTHCNFNQKFAIIVSKSAGAPIPLPPPSPLPFTSPSPSKAPPPHPNTTVSSPPLPPPPSSHTPSVSPVPHGFFSPAPAPSPKAVVSTPSSTPAYSYPPSKAPIISPSPEHHAALVPVPSPAPVPTPPPVSITTPAPSPSVSQSPSTSPTPTAQTSSPSDSSTPPDPGLPEVPGGEPTALLTPTQNAAGTSRHALMWWCVLFYAIILLFVLPE